MRPISRLAVILGVTALLLVGLQYGYKPTDGPAAPFSIQAEAAWEPGGQDVKRFCVSVAIDNRTSTDLQQVWYRLTLDLSTEIELPLSNPVYESHPIPVTPAEETGVSSFAHESTMQLSAEDAEKLKQVLRSITVEIFWWGGSQTETFPC